MRFWRRCVADPWSGGLVAVTVALFVAFQGLVGGFSLASGASHQRVVDGFVVCTLTGARLAPADPGAPLPVNGSHLCCCSLGILSQQAKLLAAALPADIALLIPVPRSSPHLWSSRPREHAPGVRRMAAAGPRAPPLPSV